MTFLQNRLRSIAQNTRKESKKPQISIVFVANIRSDKNIDDIAKVCNKIVNQS
jgi:hypothetical protein